MRCGLVDCQHPIVVTKVLGRVGGTGHRGPRPGPTLNGCAVGASGPASPHRRPRPTSNRSCSPGATATHQIGQCLPARLCATEPVRDLRQQIIETRLPVHNLIDQRQHWNLPPLLTTTTDERCDRPYHRPDGIDMRRYAAAANKTSIMFVSCRNSRSDNCGWSARRNPSRPGSGQFPALCWELFRPVER